MVHWLKIPHSQYREPELYSQIPRAAGGGLVAKSCDSSVSLHGL